VLKNYGKGVEMSDKYPEYEKLQAENDKMILEKRDMRHTIIAKEKEINILREVVEYFKYMLPLGTELQAKAREALRKIEELK
jgi:hypothetical protein